jgi:hypothetical protein
MFLSICITKWYTMAKLSEVKESELNERIGTLLELCGIGCQAKKYFKKKANQVAKKFGLRENNL